MKRSLFFLTCFILLVSTCIFLGTGCANIVPPSGGPQDSIPPVLTRAEPRDSTLNFRSNRVTFHFNEYVEVRDLPQNINFSPLAERNPEIRVRLNTITVSFRDSLLSNTTYTLNFGDAIRDINEGNILQDFSYTFSTGNRLDTGTLSGKVVLAQTGKADSTLGVVVLHRNLADTAVKSLRPPYFARLDRNGNFSFRNLPNQTFAVYVVSDAISRRYNPDDKSQYFAFNNTPITIGDSVAPLTLYAYRAQPEKATGGTATNTSRNNNANDRRIRFTTSVGNAPQDLLKPFALVFDHPLRTFDSTQISLATDSIFTPISNYTVQLDTSRKRMELRTEWKEGTQYHLIVQKDFATDTLGKALLKTDTLSFTTRRRADYGSINVKVKNIDTTQNPVLQFVQNDAIVLSVPISSGNFLQQLFLPGEYELRILYDTNRNGVWDPGQFFGVKKQPEIVHSIERRITVKAATGNDFEVSL